MPRATRAPRVVQSVPHQGKQRGGQAHLPSTPSFSSVRASRRPRILLSVLTIRCPIMSKRKPSTCAHHARGHNPAPRQECHGQEGWHVPATRIDPEVRRPIHITQCIPGEGPLCICAAHTHLVDAAWLGSVCPRPSCFPRPHQRHTQPSEFPPPSCPTRPHARTHPRALYVRAQCSMSSTTSRSHIACSVAVCV
jgi:hypothetical protein